MTDSRNSWYDTDEAWDRDIESEVYNPDALSLFDAIDDGFYDFDDTP